MVVVPSRRKWVEKFWIKYCLRCWWIAPYILIWAVLWRQTVLQDSWFFECDDYIFLDWFARLNVWLKWTMNDFVYVFDAWWKWSCGVICVWPRTNSDTIVSMFMWFCYLEWMIYGGKSIWCDLLTLKRYQVEGTVLVLVRIFCQQNKHIPPYKMIIRTMSKAASCFSNIVRVKYQWWHLISIYIYIYFY